MEPQPDEPRQAATVVLVRDAGAAVEVLLLQRNPAARFMGGAWVFPGGALDPGDADHRAAAVREVAEEAGLALPDPAALIELSRWITPPQLDVRFDTRFYVARAPAGQAPRIDGGEMVDAGWYLPSAALAAGRSGAITLHFPTVKTLEQLTAFASTDALLAWADDHEVVTLEPQISDDGKRVLL